MSIFGRLNRGARRKALRETMLGPPLALFIFFIGQYLAALDEAHAVGTQTRALPMAQSIHDNRHNAPLHMPSLHCPQSEFPDGFGP
jgi:hypothetical protein